MSRCRPRSPLKSYVEQKQRATPWLASKKTTTRSFVLSREIMARAFESIVFDGLLAVVLDLNKSCSKKKRLRA